MTASNSATDLASTEVTPDNDVSETRLYKRGYPYRGGQRAGSRLRRRPSLYGARGRVYVRDVQRRGGEEA